MTCLARGRKTGRGMVRIRGALEIRRVAGITIGRRAREFPSDVTVYARHSGVSARQWKRRLGVIEGSRPPRRGGMTDRAILRKSGSHVVRTDGALIVFLVTGGAGGRKAGKHTAGVAIRASEHSMGAGQRELGPGGVVEHGSGPTRRGGVTHGAILGKSRRGVIGIGRVVVIRQVAGGASCGSPREFPTHVTARARNGRVCAGQQKTGLAVVKGRGLPRCACVTNGAISRESGRHVIGIRSLVEIGHVARSAIRRRAGKHIVHVTLVAGDGRVRAGEREPGLIVVERRACPVGRAMADRAVLRESRSHMARICGLLEIRQMTGGASGEHECVVAAPMARAALQCRMRPRQRELRHVVVELRIEP